jgi:hypothetical protein
MSENTPTLATMKPVLMLLCACAFFLLALFHYVDQRKVHYRMAKEHALEQYAPGSMERRRLSAILEAYERGESDYQFTHEGPLPREKVTSP